MNRSRMAQDRAAQWIIAREQDGWSGADQDQLDAWLAESDMNKAAFWRLEHSWREADRIGALGRGLAPADEPPSRYRPARWWIPAAVAASIAAIAGVGFYQHPQAGRAPEIVAISKYDTPIGGRRTLGLPDGSQVELNTASAVRVAVGDQTREVWLDRGEAYFEVAHIKNRPFVVHAGSRQVTVLGTKFSVRRDGDRVTVSVLEGRVRVDDTEERRAVRSTIITSGDTALARGSATLVTARPKERVEDALAWREGMLSFDHETLAEVAAEFNRYNRKQMIVTDPEVARIRIGGAFPASSPNAFVRLLRDAYGLKIEEAPGEIRISN